MTVVDTLTTWERPYYVDSPLRPHVLSYVFGEFAGGLAPSRAKHRVSGVPAGLSIGGLAGAELLASPLLASGVLADRLAERVDLASAVRDATTCIRIAGEVVDAQSLEYMRDVIGIVAAALDAGGVAVLDPQSLSWYAPDEFRATFFDHAEPRVLPHVAFLGSEDGAPDRIWLHTRGMRKFGRPDVSVRGVPRAAQDAAFELVKRLVQSMALGAVIPDGQPIKMASLPPGMTCRHAGSLDDPDFNNVHVEIRWP